MSLHTNFTKWRKKQEKSNQQKYCNQSSFMRFELFTTKDGSLGISFWETFLAFCFGIMLLTDICVVNIPGNLRRVQIPYHIFLPFYALLPISPNYHFSPPPFKIITLHHNCLIAFWHTFMHFVAFLVFFAHKDCIWRVISPLILPPLPLKYHSQSQAPPISEWYDIWMPPQAI